MKKTVLLASVAALAFSSAAFAADAKSEVKTTATDTAGTTTKTDKTVKVDENSDGTMEKTTKTSESVDPKGLMNKSKSKTKDVEKTDAEGNTLEMSHKKTVDGKTVEETTTEKH